MIVASTGLGKTVVAVHVALHLKEEGLIDNIMAIGPKPVRNNWQTEFRQANLPFEYFIRQAFDKQSVKQDHSLELYQQILENSEQQNWLVIIDESHEFRNRFKQDLFNLKKDRKERTAFIRLRQLISKGNHKVLLLTGSPYARNIENINNQLYLLPHNCENNPNKFHHLLEDFPEYQDLFNKETQDEKAWSIHSPGDFINLSVASQLTTPHVAKYYGQKDNDNTYIIFGEEKRYVPHVILYTINFPLILEQELTNLIRPLA